MNIEDALQAAAGTLEQLVRAIVREELRRALGPGPDQLLNVKSAPMKPRKLRGLIRGGELRGFKVGRETFVYAADMRAFVERHLIAPVRTQDIDDGDLDELRRSLLRSGR